MTQPSWAWPPPATHIGHPPDLSMVLGRLLERSEATLERLDRIDRRLEDGDGRMDEISERIASLEANKADPMPGWERKLKGVAPYLIFTAALAGTGSIEGALKILAALGGAK